MAVQAFFNNQRRVEPGVYARTVSNVKNNQIVVGSSGNVAIIDTGALTVSPSFNGGAGIAGTNTKGKKSIYSFTDVNAFQNFIKGGILWDIAPLLFVPKPGMTGVQTLHYISARASLPAGVGFAIINPETTLYSAGVDYISVEENALISTNSPHGLSTGDRVFIANGGGLTIAPGVPLSGQIVTVTVVNTYDFYTGLDTTSSPNGYNNQGRVALIIAGYAISTFYDEGASCNGVAGSDITPTGSSCPLAKGYSIKVRAGKKANSLAIDFFQGSWKGLDTTSALPNPKLLFSSPDIQNSVELEAYFANDTTLNALFRVSVIETSQSWAGESITNAITYNPGHRLFTGGADMYLPEHLDSVLEAITELDNSFFLSDRFGFFDAFSALDTENVKIATSLETLLYKKFLIIGGGNSPEERTGSIGSSTYAAFFYNNSKVQLIHGKISIPAVRGLGLREVSSFYSAAAYLGMLAGLQPQTSITFKPLPNVRDVSEDLTEAQRVELLQAGVLHFRKIGDSWCINQAVNTLQDNLQLLLPNGDSFSVEEERITSQLNKELILTLLPRIVGNNFNTMGAGDIYSLVDAFLSSKVATKLQDNLILSYSDIQISLNSGDWYITYSFTSNGTANKVFITGVQLPAVISA